MDAKIIYFCRTILALEVQGERLLNKWPEQPISWCSIGGVGQVSAGDFQAVIPWFHKPIEAVCGARFAYTPNSKTANVIYRAAKRGEGGMGQQGEVLADATVVPAGLRRNADFRGICRLDWAEHFTSLDRAEAFAQNKIPIIDVGWHETCHLLGLGHSPDKRDIMYAGLSEDTEGFRPWSIGELTRRYGAVVVQPTPAPAPAPGPLPADPIHWEIRAGSSTLTVVGVEPQIFRNGKRQSCEDSVFA